MNVIDIIDHEDRETVLILATDYMARIAETPSTPERDETLRELAAKVTELAGAA